jgi:hypothetical protein
MRRQPNDSNLALWGGVIPVAEHRLAVIEGQADPGTVATFTATSRSQSMMPRRRQNRVGTNGALPSSALRVPTAPAPGPARCHQP